MAVKLEKMSRDELEQLTVAIQDELKKRKVEERKKALAEAEAAAAQYGFSLAELTSGGKASKMKSASVIKYRSPEDPSKTWSGRGRRPEWIKQLDADGRLDDALVA